MPENDVLDLLNVDLRAADTQWGIHVTKMFLQLTEAQMSDVVRRDLDALRAGVILKMDVEEYSMELRNHEMFYNEGILPTLRYSHVVLLHILAETQLRSFCLIMKKEKALPDLIPGDFRGSPMDQIQIYLKKLIGISIGEIPQWESLRNLQKVRDCIVHVYGVVGESRDKDLAGLISKTSGLGIDDQGRLDIKIEYCAAQIEIIREFFDALFRKVGWKV